MLETCLLEMKLLEIEEWLFMLLCLVVPESPPGVYLYLGYSRIDAEILKQGRMKLNDEVIIHVYKKI